MRRLLGILKRKLKRSLELFPHAAKMFWGLGVYALSGKTPNAAYQSMIMLNCKTNRRATEKLGRFFSTLNPINFRLEGQGVLGNAADPQIQSYAEKIKKEGYAELGVRLSPEQCAALKKLSLTLPGKLEGRYAKASGAPRKIYDPARPESKTYKFDEQDLVQDPTVQALMADPTLHALAAQYLGATPILCSVNMWWSAVMPGEKLTAATDDAAQMFHFDMSRCKWLNMFFYLTDVTPEAGPHCVVPGTHMPEEERGYHLLQRGYARIEDREIIEAFGPDRIVEITGPAGTLLAEDTKAFHKGTVPKSKDRLMFEMVFAVSLFGGAYDRTAKPQAMLPELQKAMAEKPRIFTRFYSKNA